MFTAIIGFVGALFGGVNNAAQSQYGAQLNAREQKRAALQMQQNTVYRNNNIMLIAIALVVVVMVFFLIKK